MKKFSDYTKFVGKRRREIEEENRKWETEDDKQTFFFSRKVIPALVKMAHENQTFRYECKGTEEDRISLSQSYDLLINENSLSEGRYQLDVKLHLHEKDENLVFRITNYHSDKEVEGFDNYEDMNPELVEHIITDLLMKLYEKDQQ